LSNLHIKFSGLDEKSGAIFLQFASDDTLHLIDQSTIHGFFPSQYNTHEIEELIPYMAEFGSQILNQQTSISQNQFSQEQVIKFNQLVGITKVVPVTSAPTQVPAGQANQYDLDSNKNPNGQVDHFRNIVLEVLAEEGLILGKVK
jgi:transcriptional regulator of heat shock response